jgi:hypothetical protein
LIPRYRKLFAIDEKLDDIVHEARENHETNIVNHETQPLKYEEKAPAQH